MSASTHDDLHGLIIPAGLLRRFRDRRKFLELSQEQLSEVIGISRPYVSLLESGARRPSSEVLDRWTKALRGQVVVSVEWES